MTEYSRKHGIRQHAKGRIDVFKIDPRIIEIDPDFNVRGEDNFGDMEGLVASILANGVLEPLRVKCVGDRVILRSGHRRLRAVMLLIEQGHEFKAISVTSEPPNCSDAQSNLELITRNDGLPLTPLEQGKVFQRLINFGWNHKEIAERSGRAVATITNYLKLATASPAIQQMIAEEKVSSSAALEVINEHQGDESAQIAKIEKALDASFNNRTASGKATLKNLGVRKTKSDWKIVKNLCAEMLEALRVARHAKVIDYELRFKRLFESE